tara:strand:- start:310 stop:498 length:189 start_codon:yes stop_codon:yes gene_type:complete
MSPFAAPNGFIRVLKNPDIIFQKKKSGAKTRPDDDEDDTDMEHIIIRGIMLAAIFIPSVTLY